VTHILDADGLFGTHFAVDSRQVPGTLVWSSNNARIFKVDRR
jgi:hypothetical protein